MEPPSSSGIFASEAAIRAHRGIMLLEQRRFAEAEPFFREALATAPTDEGLLYQLTTCLYYQEDREKEALEVIDTLLRHAPTIAPAHALRALILSDLNRHADAQAAAETAIKLDPAEGFGFRALAGVYLARQNWAKAEKAAREALAVDPDDVAASNLLAHSLRLQNKREENASQIEAALRRDPENPDTHATAGWSHLQAGRNCDAERHFVEALRLNPANEAARFGLMEAFKARSPIYRAYIAYNAWMASFSPGARWGIIIGILFFVQAAHAVLPPLAASVLVLFWLMLVCWTHVAGHIGGVLLLFDPLARHALRRSEARAAITVSGSLFLGLPILATGLVLLLPGFVLAGLCLAGASVPASYTFTNKSVWGSRLFGSFVILAWLAAIVLLLTEHMSAAYRVPSTLLGMLAILTLMASTWMANFDALNERR